jgi:hypothetical protein
LTLAAPVSPTEWNTFRFAASSGATKSWPVTSARSM